MSVFRFWILAVTAVVFFAGCATGPLNIFQSKADKALSAGIKSYEAGNYKESAKSLQSALDLGLPDKADQVKARKYLAFVHCISGREKQCRDEFRNALEINPNFELEPAEAGHPQWGPVFRSVKGQLPK